MVREFFRSINRNGSDLRTPGAVSTAAIGSLGIGEMFPAPIGERRLHGCLV